MRHACAAQEKQFWLSQETLGNSSFLPQLVFSPEKKKGKRYFARGNGTRRPCCFPRFTSCWIVIIKTRRGLLLPADPHGPIRYFIYAQWLHRACHRLWQRENFPAGSRGSCQRSWSQRGYLETVRNTLGNRRKHSFKTSEKHNRPLSNGRCSLSKQLMAVIFGSSGGGSSGAIFFFPIITLRVTIIWPNNSGILHSIYVHMQNLKTKCEWNFLLLQNAWSGKKLMSFQAFPNSLLFMLADECSAN